MSARATPTRRRSIGWPRRPGRPTARRRSALASLAAALPLSVSLLPSCTATLPFDELTGSYSGPAPKLHFALDETRGGTAVDARGGKTLASIETPSGKDWVPARRGNGLATEGDNFLTIESLSGSRFPERGTFAFWSKIDAIPVTSDGAEADLLTALEYVSEDEQRFPLLVYENKDTFFFRRTFQVADDDGGIDSKFPNPGLGKWVLVVVGWDVANDRTIFYVRGDDTPGIRVNVQTGGFPPSFALGKPAIFIGASGGIIDDVKYWDRLLTNEEIQKLD